MAPLIKVRLPPCSSPNAQLGHTTPSSSSLLSSSAPKRDETHLQTGTPSIIPSTPKRQTPTTPHPPSRRNNKRYNASSNHRAIPPTSAPNSPSPVRKLKRKSPRSKKNILTTCSSSLDSSSSLKSTSTSALEKGRSGNGSNSSSIVPFNRSKKSAGKTTLKETVKKRDLLNYEDPLLSTTTTTTTASNKTISLSNRSIVSSVPDTSKKLSSSTTPIVPVGPSKEVKEVQKEVGKIIGAETDRDGGCDDSGCDIGWEDSFYSSRNRTCSNSSTFTSITTSSFTSSSMSTNDTSAIEDSTLLFNQDYNNNNRNDSMFTPTTDSFSRHFIHDNDEYGDAQDASRTRTRSSPPTISPASSSSSVCFHHHSHHFTSSPPFVQEQEEEGTCEKDLLLSESFPCFHVSDRLARQVSSSISSLLDGIDMLEEQKDDDDANEDDFPLSMLEKNIRGLIDEPVTTATTTSFSIFPTPPLRDSSRKQTVQSITPYSRQRLQGFSGISPLPQTPFTSFTNALELFESKLELSKKASYPFLSSSSSFPSLVNSKSMDTLTNNAKGVFIPENGNENTIYSERNRTTFGDEFPICRCGCGEQKAEEIFQLTRSTPSFGPHRGKTFAPLSPLSIEAAQQEKSNILLETLEKSSESTKNKTAQHKSIWSISSPPISPIKKDKISNHTALSFNFDDEIDDPIKVEYGNHSTMHLPTEEYAISSYHHQLQASVSGIVPASSSSHAGYKLRRAISSQLPMNSSEEHAQGHATSFEYSKYGPPSPYPFTHYNQHGSSYSAPPRHAHSHNDYNTSQQQYYDNHYCHQQRFFVHQPQGPSPNNKKGELYKTELCKSWSEIGNCRYGEKCQFAHGLIELRSMSNNHNYYQFNDRDHHREHSVSLSPYDSSSTSFYNNYKFPYSPTPLNSEYKKHQFVSNHHEENIIGHKRIEGEGLQPMLETRRRSVSSPSKIRMYGLNNHKTTPIDSSLEGENLYSIWNNHNTFDVGKNMQKIHLSINDDIDDDIFGQFSPFPRDSNPDKKNLLCSEKSLFAALKAEAADAPIPTFNIGPQ